jgi:hypothetical protein
MNQQLSPAFLFWWRWLVVATLGVVGAGAFFVVAPGVTREVFGLLFYGSSEALDDLPARAVAYIAFAHGVLGAAMIGWGVALAAIVLGPLRQAGVQAWRTFAGSLSIWFVVDSGFSLWSGFWQNAILNAVVFALFVPALVGIRRHCSERSDR